MSQTYDVVVIGAGPAGSAAAWQLASRGHDVVLVGWALGVYGLTQGLLQIPFGMLSDRIGRKPIVLGGCLLAALTYFPLFSALTEVWCAKSKGRDA